MPAIANVSYPRLLSPLPTSIEAAMASVCELLGRFRKAATGLSKEYLSIVSPYLSALNDENLVSLLRRIVEFRHEEEADWRPSDSAFKRTVELIAELCVSRRHFPPAFVSAEGDGAIRITWKNPPGEVRIVIAGGEQDSSYLYFQTATEYSLVERINGQTISNYLKRINL